MRVCLLASGSKGNSVFVEAGASRVLVDAGLSARELLLRLAAIGVEGQGLDAILISHEHTDHIRGAGALARKLKIPLCSVIQPAGPAAPPSAKRSLSNSSPVARLPSMIYGSIPFP